MNASGIERSDFGVAVGGTPLVEISATGAYLDALRAASSGSVVLGAGLAPGLSTILAAELDSRPGDDVDVLVMLGSGEKHGPAAVAWTADLVGTDIYRPPEHGPVRNLVTSTKAEGPDGRTRRHFRADFPDHVLLGADRGLAIRSYLALSSAPATAVLAAVGRLPRLHGLLRHAPRIGSADWQVLARNRRTGQHLRAHGTGQSEATGRLTALAAVRAVSNSSTGSTTMADLMDSDEAREALGSSPADGSP
ncbi:hypothetical protein ACFVJS_05825 [Nocardioides sp. NPDC057772]|uniref:hypothetical protein n=1 Tax=Nocardioides sp. NPDC057772 TaxID=3346245 RepID=UPI00367267AA